MKITMMMSSGSCQLGSWSYKVGVWSESHGCPSFMLLVVLFFTKILPLGSLSFPQSSQLHCIMGNAGWTRDPSHVLTVSNLLKKICPTTLWNYNNKSLECPLNKDIFPIWMSRYCRLLAHIVP